MARVRKLQALQTADRAERFDKQVADLFDMQDEIAARWANAPTKIIQSMSVNTRHQTQRNRGKFPGTHLHTRICCGC